MKVCILSVGVRGVGWGLRGLSLTGRRRPLLPGQQAGQGLHQQAPGKHRDTYQLGKNVLFKLPQPPKKTLTHTILKDLSTEFLEAENDLPYCLVYCFFLMI